MNSYILQNVAKFFCNFYGLGRNFCVPTENLGGCHFFSRYLKHVMQPTNLNSESHGCVSIFEAAARVPIGCAHSALKFGGFGINVPYEHLIFDRIQDVLAILTFQVQLVPGFGGFLRTVERPPLWPHKATRGHESTY